MTDVKNMSETKIPLNKFVTIIFDESTFFNEGKIAAVFDDTILTKGEVSEIIQEFFMHISKVGKNNVFCANN